MLTVSSNSSYEDGTMLAKLNPLDIRIFNTRQRVDYSLIRAHEFRSRMCSRLLRIVYRRQLSYFNLFFDAYFRLPVLEQ